MKSATFLAVLSAVAGALAQNPTLNTPNNLVACQPVQLNWGGGKAPYFISVQDGNNPSGAALTQFPEQSGTSLTWLVNFQPGTSLGFLLRDSNGVTSQTASVTVQPGSGTDCVGKTASISGGGSNTAGTGAPPQSTGGSNTASTTSTTGGSGTSVTTSSGPSNTSGTSGSSNNNNAASASSAQIGAAGIVGAAVLALLA
ncbi:hypothetical protein AAF712_011215 [Marasmius tenuissimus]|uniref:Secreted protein n=1 Tax=Marasmius tenuissimus TaxID=585030 RepID=A0ABR2ZK41_9AGAR